MNLFGGQKVKGQGHQADQCLLKEVGVVVTVVGLFQ